MFEKRSKKRTQLLYYLNVSETNTGQDIGRVVDITTEGMRLISEVPVPVNRIFNLTLTLPEVFDGKKTIEFDAKSVQSNQLENSDFFDTGLQILDISEAEQSIVTKLIDEFEFPTGLHE